MEKVTCFEDLLAWQKARILSREICDMTRQGEIKKDYALSNQLQRAAVSIMANIAEGFERNRKAEFHQFLSVAKASCAELRSHLYAALDARYLSEEHFKILKSHAEEVGRMLGGLRAATAKQRDALDS
jgi:four helix bundle protein